MDKLLLAAVIGSIAPGCILYEDRYHSDGGCGGCEPSPTSDPPPGAGTSAGTDTGAADTGAP